MNDVNSIIFDLRDYDTIEEMWKDIADAMRILTRKRKYIVQFKHEDCDIYVLEFNYADRSYGCAYPYWLTPEQEEKLI